MAGRQRHDPAELRAERLTGTAGGEVIRAAGNHHLRHPVLLREFQQQAAGLQRVVIAAKGIGGYHLICDARSEKAVSRLRDIKQRDGMPFAVLFRDIDIMRTLPLVCWNTD